MPYTRFQNVSCSGLSARAETLELPHKLGRVLIALNITVTASIKGKRIFRYRVCMWKLLNILS